MSSLTMYCWLRFRGLDAEVVDGDDVGVVEGGDGAGFALEAAAKIGELLRLHGGL